HSQSDPGALSPESKDLSSAVTVWTWLPPLCQTTVAPALTVRSAGSNRHCCALGSASNIVTRWPWAAPAGDQPPWIQPRPAPDVTATSAATIDRVPLRTLLLSAFRPWVSQRTRRRQSTTRRPEPTITTRRLAPEMRSEEHTSELQSRGHLV